ncbi:PREDICTED: uncharacterized protein LOC109290230 [Gavialis gangeticus]|uniref:uncharacterized protein LOC109290230 n=1 Tax=Gavialis gangeticus TaxID=94835 RepID=UPI00092FD90B|nr:PREDICTED: uncharacterized protein LOC109290230 [Gavialis gangeticus]
MSAKNLFFKVWKNNISIIAVLFYCSVFILIEESMEVEFKCPANNRWKVPYTFSFFFLPCLIWFAVALIFQAASFRICCCTDKFSWHRFFVGLGKALLPSVFWVLILFLDGRYLQCLCGTWSYSWQWCTNMYMISQWIGLTALCVIAITAAVYTLFPYWYCKAHRQGRTYEEIEDGCILEEETEKYLLEKLRETNRQAAKDFLERDYGHQLQIYLKEPSKETLERAIQKVLCVNRKVSSPQEHMEMQNTVTI